MQEKTFKKGLAILVKSFPDKQFDYDIMWQFLSDIEDNIFIDSIAKVVLEKNDINKATNIVAIIREYSQPENTVAGEAWGEVLKLVGSVGSWGKPKFSDEVIQRAVDSIGWYAICASENIAIERAHFLKVYEAVDKRKKHENISNLPQIKKLIENVLKNIT